jgi:hypothetical protein
MKMRGPALGMFMRKYSGVDAYGSKEGIYDTPHRPIAVHESVATDAV